MTTQRLKRLKTLKSLETDCTLQDSRQKNFKINILKPINPMSSVKLGSSGQLSPPQPQLQSIKVNKNQHLINIPELPKKQLQMQLLQSNNTDPQQSQCIRSSNKSNQRSIEFFDESMDFREMVMTNGSIRETTSKKMGNLGFSKNRIGLQNSKRQQDNISIDDRLSNIIRMSQNKEIDSEESQLEVQINLEQSQQIHQQVEQESKEKRQLVKKVIDFKEVAPKLKLSSKYDQLYQSERRLKQNRSSSKLKLKDYLYMVQASGKNLQNKKKQLKNAHRVAQVQVPKITNAKSQQRLNLRSCKNNIEINGKDNFLNRKEAIKSKYNVSNRTMFDILKQEICLQVKMAEQNLQRVKNELQEVQASNEPTNQELLILYNLRREMKEYINKKLEYTIESIRKQKKQNILKCSHKSHEVKGTIPQQIYPFKNKI